VNNSFDRALKQRHLQSF